MKHSSNLPTFRIDAIEALCSDSTEALRGHSQSLTTTASVMLAAGISLALLFAPNLLDVYVDILNVTVDAEHFPVIVPGSNPNLFVHNWARLRGQLSNQLIDCHGLSPSRVRFALKHEVRPQKSKFSSE